MSRRYAWLNAVREAAIERVLDTRAVYDAACKEPGIIQGAPVDEAMDDYRRAFDTFTS